MEACCTLGMLTEDQARRLAEAGLSAYNHNLDTSEEYYGAIITTRTYEDRLRTIANVAKAGISVCCGGILGMGESKLDRIKLLHTLANLDPQPESVPINALVPVDGTPLRRHSRALDTFDWIRAIAVARILMPRAMVRLSAGRLSIPREAQALAFLAGANSIFTGEKLLTTPNPEADFDRALLADLGLHGREPDKHECPKDRHATAGAGTRAAEERVPASLVLACRAASTSPPTTISGSPNTRRCAQAVLEALDAGRAARARPARGCCAVTTPSTPNWRRSPRGFFGAERALYFSTGFLANFALFTTLPHRHDAIVFDERVHASVKEGVHAGHASHIKVPHNDVDAFEDAIVRARRAGARDVWIAVESVYSMDGDIAPVDDLHALARAHDAVLIVDEAHASGIFGPTGRGFTEGTLRRAADHPAHLRQGAGRRRRPALRPGGGDRLPDQRGAAVHLLDGAAALRRRGRAPRAASWSTRSPGGATGCGSSRPSPAGGLPKLSATCRASRHADHPGDPRRRRAARIAAAEALQRDGLRRARHPPADGAGRNLAPAHLHRRRSHGGGDRGAGRARCRRALAAAAK